MTKPEVKIGALRDPFEKLVNYIELCKTCMYGYPNDLWGNQQASNLRASYMKSAFGAIDFITKCYPELHNDDAIMEYLESQMDEMQKIADSYYTIKDKKKMQMKSFEELYTALVNKS